MKLSRSHILMFAGLALVIAGLAGVRYNSYLQRILRTPYPMGEMRKWETERIRNYPYFLGCLGVTTLLLGVVSRCCPGIILTRGKRFAGEILVLGAIAGGAIMSFREWRYYDCPVWDGYGDFSLRFYQLIFAPSQENFLLFSDFIRNYIHASNPVGPALIALINRLLKDIRLSYQLTMFLATLASGLLLKRIMRVFYGMLPSATMVYLVLFFSHFSVMRSSLFPQMDALMLLWVTIFLYLAYSYFDRPRSPALYLISAIIVLALFTKVNGFFIMPALPAVYLVRSLKTGSFEGRAFFGICFWSVIIPVGLFAIYLWGFDFHGLFLRELRARSDSWWRWDHSLKLFLITFFSCSQLYLYLMFNRDNVRPSRAFLPGALIFFTVLSLSAGSAAFWQRFFLPLVPGLIILSRPRLEKIRAADPIFFCLMIFWIVAYNYLFLIFRLYY